MLVSPRAPMNVQNVPNSPVSDDTAQYSALSSCASFSASCSIWEYWAGDWQKNKSVIHKTEFVSAQLVRRLKRVTVRLWKFSLLLFYIQNEGFSSGEGGISLSFRFFAAAGRRQRTTFLRFEAAAAKPNAWHPTPETNTDTFMETSALNAIKTYAQVFLCAHQEQLDRCGVVLLQRVFQPLPADRKRRL